MEAGTEFTKPEPLYELKQKIYEAQSVIELIKGNEEVGAHLANACIVTIGLLNAAQDQIDAIHEQAKAVHHA